ncbi:uncharacterized protein LOC132902166 [Amyelois transitella]|uniref:uncharacterized protein LOC132902166 n=1 Tax=Amyelois transitella TaxID=680683 RepID=UPI00299061B6|nr:uncharacterized protein LOC132902166 [Amyelois transitella]
MVVFRHANRELLMINGFTYSKKKPRNWYCSKRKTMHCLARATFDGQGALAFLSEDHNHGVYFTVNRKGNTMLLVDGQRFSKEYERNGKTRWRCIKRNTGCRSAAVTIDDDIISVTIMAAILRARFAPEPNNIYVGGHKFCRHSRSLVGDRIRWTCSKKHKHKCKATAVTVDGIIVSTSGQHSHL